MTASPLEWHAMLRTEVRHGWHLRLLQSKRVLSERESVIQAPMVPPMREPALPRSPRASMGDSLSLSKNCFYHGSGIAEIYLLPQLVCGQLPGNAPDSTVCVPKQAQDHFYGEPRSVEPLRTCTICFRFQALLGSIAALTPSRPIPELKPTAACPEHRQGQYCPNSNCAGMYLGRGRGSKSLGQSRLQVSFTTLSGGGLPGSARRSLLVWDGFPLRSTNTRGYSSRGRLGESGLFGRFGAKPQPQADKYRPTPTRDPGWLNQLTKVLSSEISSPDLHPTRRVAP